LGTKTEQKNAIAARQNCREAAVCRLISRIKVSFGWKFERARRDLNTGLTQKQEKPFGAAWMLEKSSI
jgi:hypothetical protein